MTDKPLSPAEQDAAATLADIRLIARGGINMTTADLPLGTFIATTAIDGRTVMFLLRGEINHDSAAIVGRYEFDVIDRAYFGGGIAGGQEIKVDGSYVKAFWDIADLDWARREE